MDQQKNMLLGSKLLGYPPSRGYEYGGPQEQFLSGNKQGLHIIYKILSVLKIIFL
jgi:hypothetical protein